MKYASRPEMFFLPNGEVLGLPGTTGHLAAPKVTKMPSVYLVKRRPMWRPALSQRVSRK